ncbi:MAG TPA: GspH/FimT family pseudopilin [Pseudomonas sp.]|uniref:GspH/FimT family pseudopilin n=1 Tax=Pseudomonas sp. TaxID=306 RepID=UPI002BDE1079|nr:GspH/FimT family pseudopilin [Pseudomonas sp.]HRL92204.1 GspH/FimT family pseudopilin [Pseudomonas sp.]
MENGASLTESLITLSLISVLAMIALPSLNAWIEQNRLETATHQIRQDMAYARYQAVMHQRAVIIQPARANCWHCGWHVQLADTATPAQVLIKREALDQQLRVTSSRSWQAGATFMPNGAAVQPGGAFAAGTFTLCTPNSSQHFKVIISKSGRARTTREQSLCLW